MIKKIALTLILCCVVVSCGKKGDPIYKDTGKKIEKQSLIIYRA